MEGEKKVQSIFPESMVKVQLRNQLEEALAAVDAEVREKATYSFQMLINQFSEEGAPSGNFYDRKEFAGYEALLEGFDEMWQEKVALAMERWMPGQRIEFYLDAGSERIASLIYSEYGLTKVEGFMPEEAGSLNTNRPPETRDYLDVIRVTRSATGFSSAPPALRVYDDKSGVRVPVAEEEDSSPDSQGCG